jgi:hypothetical protein
MGNQFKVVLSYNFNTDETKIKTSSNWGELSTIHQLDALQDSLVLLTEYYNDTLERFHHKEIHGVKAILKLTNKIEKRK